MPTRRKAVPDLAQETKAAPETEQRTTEMPEISKPKDFPEVGNPENTVIIGGKLIEVKPTKLKYHRNRTAVFYRALEMYPLPDILAMEVNPKTGLGPFGDKRDGDKALCDWLVAVLDDEDLVREHIDEFDSQMIYKLLAIFRRLNRIDEMEEKLKNARTPGEA